MKENSCIKLIVPVEDVEASAVEIAVTESSNPLEFARIASKSFVKISIFVSYGAVGISIRTGKTRASISASVVSSSNPAAIV